MTPPSTSSPPQSILLLGAGELGSAILTHLGAHPSLAQTRLTILLRPSSLTDASRLDSLRALLPPNRRPLLSLAGLDLSTPTAQHDLAALIADGAHDAVVACTGMATSGSAAGTQRLIAEAVLSAAGAGAGKRGGGAEGTKQQQPLRFFPWQFGADYDAIGPRAAGGLMAEQCDVRARLRERAAGAGVAWTVVSTGLFMSFLFEESFGVVEGLGGALRVGGPEPLADEGAADVVVRGLGGWGNRVTVTDVGDIGKVVAELVALPVEESAVFTAGQTVTYGEVAEVVQRIVGRRKEVKREEWSVELLKDELQKDPENQMKKYRLLFAEGTGVSWDMGKTINAQRGIDMVGVERWLREKLSM